MWTEFWDMHSGGGQKEAFARCYIEAPLDEAKVIFYNRFGHNPDRITCTCCGPDYSIDESETLEHATGFHRGCAHDGDTYIEESRNESWNPYMTLEEYVQRPEVCVIRAHEITDEDRSGEVPPQGYVWV